MNNHHVFDKTWVAYKNMIVVTVSVHLIPGLTYILVMLWLQFDPQLCSLSCKKVQVFFAFKNPASWRDPLLFLFFFRSMVDWDLGLGTASYRSS